MTVVAPADPDARDALVAEARGWSGLVGLDLAREATTLQ